MSEEQAHHHVNYLLVFIVLCVLTTLSVVADVVDINSKLLVIVIVLAIATAKALCVMAFFMHLKFEGRWKFLLLAPTTILAIGLPMVLMTDVGVHYYTVDVPQSRIERTADDDHASEHRDEPTHGGH